MDQYNTLKRFSDYLACHEEEYAALKVKDKEWYTVKYGYFVLVSNIDATPKDLLSEYFGRTDIEIVFKQRKSTWIFCHYQNGPILQREERYCMTSLTRLPCCSFVKVCVSQGCPLPRSSADVSR